MILLWVFYLLSLSVCAARNASVLLAVTDFSKPEVSKWPHGSIPFLFDDPADAVVRQRFRQAAIRVNNLISSVHVYEIDRKYWTWVHHPSLPAASGGSAERTDVGIDTVDLPSRRGSPHCLVSEEESTTIVDCRLKCLAAPSCKFGTLSTSKRRCALFNCTTSASSSPQYSSFAVLPAHPLRVVSYRPPPPLHPLYCSSHVGYIAASLTSHTRFQNHIVLSPSCEVGAIVHELFHTLGAIHEHTRQERDRHIRIAYPAVAPDVPPSIFQLDPAHTPVTPYDMRSILHYSSTAGAAAGLLTLEALNPDDAASLAAPRQRVSVSDVLGMESVYGSEACRAPRVGVGSQVGVVATFSVGKSGDASAVSNRSWGEIGCLTAATASAFPHRVTYSWTCPSSGDYIFSVQDSSARALVVVVPGVCAARYAECGRVGGSVRVSVSIGEEVTVIMTATGEGVAALTISQVVPKMESGSVEGTASRALQLITSTPACGVVGGWCGDVRLPCNGGVWVSGLCAGGYFVRCCVVRRHRSPAVAKDSGTGVVLRPPPPAPHVACSGVFGGATFTYCASAGAAALAFHNTLRTQLCGMWKYSGGGLVWGDALAASAAAWVRGLASSPSRSLRRDPSAQSKGEAENLAVFTVADVGADLSAVQLKAVREWAAEAACYSAATGSCRGQCRSCGHYAQMVWDSTTHVGCAAAMSIDGLAYVSCRYRPPGNVRVGGQPLPPAYSCSPPPATAPTTPAGTGHVGVGTTGARAGHTVSASTTARKVEETKWVGGPLGALARPCVSPPLTASILYLAPQHGTCVDTTTTHCHGRLERGLCGSSRRVMCCIDTSAAAAAVSFSAELDQPTALLMGIQATEMAYHAASLANAAATGDGQAGDSARGGVAPLPSRPPHLAVGDVVHPGSRSAAVSQAVEYVGPGYADVAADGYAAAAAEWLRSQSMALKATGALLERKQRTLAGDGTAGIAALKEIRSAVRDAEGLLGAVEWSVPLQVSARLWALRVHTTFPMASPVALRSRVADATAPGGSWAFVGEAVASLPPTDGWADTDYIRAAVRQWGESAQHYIPFTGDCGEGVASRTACAAYRQLVWNGTQRMGCAVVSGPPSPLVTVVCWFGPGAAAYSLPYAPSKTQPCVSSACVNVAEPIHQAYGPCAHGNRQGTCLVASACRGEGFFADPSLCPGSDDVVCCLQAVELEGSSTAAAEPQSCMGRGRCLLASTCSALEGHASGSPECGGDLWCCLPKGLTTARGRDGDVAAGNVTDGGEAVARSAWAANSRDDVGRAGHVAALSSAGVTGQLAAVSYCPAGWTRKAWDVLSCTTLAHCDAITGECKRCVRIVGEKCHIAPPENDFGCPVGSSRRDAPLCRGECGYDTVAAVMLKCCAMRRSGPDGVVVCEALSQAAPLSHAGGEVGATEGLGGGGGSGLGVRPLLSSSGVQVLKADLRPLTVRVMSGHGIRSRMVSSLSGASQPLFAAGVGLASGDVVSSTCAAASVDDVVAWAGCGGKVSQLEVEPGGSGYPSNVFGVFVKVVSATDPEPSNFRSHHLVGTVNLSSFAWSGGYELDGEPKAEGFALVPVTLPMSVEAHVALHATLNCASLGERSYAPFLYRICGRSGKAAGVQCGEVPRPFDAHFVNMSAVQEACVGTAALASCPLRGTFCVGGASPVGSLVCSSWGRWEGESFEYGSVATFACEPPEVSMVGPLSLSTGELSVAVEVVGAHLDPVASVGMDVGSDVDPYAEVIVSTIPTTSPSRPIGALSSVVQTSCVIANTLFPDWGAHCRGVDTRPFNAPSATSVFDLNVKVVVRDDDGGGDGEVVGVFGPVGFDAVMPIANEAGMLSIRVDGVGSVFLRVAVAGCAEWVTNPAGWQGDAESLCARLHGSSSRMDGVREVRWSGLPYAADDPGVVLLPNALWWVEGGAPPTRAIAASKLWPVQTVVGAPSVVQDELSLGTTAPASSTAGGGGGGVRRAGTEANVVAAPFIVQNAKPVHPVGFVCGATPEDAAGYVLIGALVLDAFGRAVTMPLCEDIDECAGEDGVCADHASCVNAAGGYVCTCDVGYVGDGVTGCYAASESGTLPSLCDGGGGGPCADSAECVGEAAHGDAFTYRCRCPAGTDGDPLVHCGLPVGRVSDCVAWEAGSCAAAPPQGLTALESHHLEYVVAGLAVALAVVTFALIVTCCRQCQKGTVPARRGPVPKVPITRSPVRGTLRPSDTLSPNRARSFRSEIVYVTRHRCTCRSVAITPGGSIILIQM